MNMQWRSPLSKVAGVLFIGFSASITCAAATPQPSAPERSDSVLLDQGINPHPVVLVVPPTRPLSAMAQLGRKLFHEPALSGSGQMSCASCHDGAHAYGPPGDVPVMIGGLDMHTSGVRAVPSLRYLYRQPAFSVGPDTSSGDND